MNCQCFKKNFSDWLKENNDYDDDQELLKKLNPEYDNDNDDDDDDDDDNDDDDDC